MRESYSENREVNMSKLGKVISQGCYKNDKRMSDAKFTHNCIAAGGNEVRWEFQVLNEQNELIGTVVAGLSCSFDGDESQQKAAILGIAKGLIP